MRNKKGQFDKGVKLGQPFKKGHSLNKTHGMSNTPTYRSWQNMWKRVRTPEDYPTYIGIKICERWQKFENFFTDMGERPKGMTLDRRDSKADYTPSNCRWATSVEQAREKIGKKVNITWNTRPKCKICHKFHSTKKPCYETVIEIPE